MNYGAIIPLPLGSASESSNNTSTETILMLFQLGCVYLGYLSLKLRLYYRFCITFSGYHFLQVKWCLKKLVGQIESCCIKSFLECLPSVIWINESWELCFVYQKTSPFMKMFYSTVFADTFWIFWYPDLLNLDIMYLWFILNS